MPSFKQLKHRIKSDWIPLSLKLGTLDQLVPIAIMGIFTGLLTSLVIIAFRDLTWFGQAGFLPGGLAENFEALPWWARLALPAAGGLLVGLFLNLVPESAREVGVTHVMEQLSRHHGYLPVRNAVVQFVGASLSIISGHSVGREGPGVHLGAASGNYLGQRLNLPNNTTRILVSCGVAASIAASFNTPLAGVIFSMEVIMMEYTVIGFIPVMLAAIIATTITRNMYGSDTIFAVPSFELSSLWEMPLVFVAGLAIGVLAAVFIKLLRYFSGCLVQRPIWYRTTAAGLLIGICALFVPQIMGLGYDTTNAALLNQLGIGMLLAVALMKVFATAAGLGLGLPGGLIGPTIVIGATAGGLFGGLGDMFFADNGGSAGIYAMLGMGAMMGATLQAPLAALVALLELTGNANIILPGMLAIIVACLTSSQLFGNESVYLQQLKARGIEYIVDPVTQYLRRVSVASALNTRVKVSGDRIRHSDLQRHLEDGIEWLLISPDDMKYVWALDITNLAVDERIAEDDPLIPLKNLDAPRYSVSPVAYRASLQEAVATLRTTSVDALYVIAPSHFGWPDIMGIVTRGDIEERYLKLD